MTDVGQAVGLRIGAYESQGASGSSGVLPFDGLIDVALASTGGTGGEAQPTGSTDEQRALVSSYAAISAVLILAVVMIIGRRRVKSMLLRTHRSHRCSSRRLSTGKAAGSSGDDSSVTRRRGIIPATATT